MWAPEAGTRFLISHPRSHFEFAAGATEVLLLAGGIGVTPMVGMAEALARRGARFRMVYAGRSRPLMAYLDELSALLGPALAVKAEDEGGRPDLDAIFAGLAPDAEAYVCGPIGLLTVARRAWAAANAGFARSTCWPWRGAWTTATSSSRSASTRRTGGSAPASRASWAVR